MNTFAKTNLIDLLRTSAGNVALAAAANVSAKEIVSAVKYYMGKPDGRYFTSKDFPEEVVNAKKCYVTLNTIIGGDTAEYDRFSEGKKQVPELITPIGVKKCLNLFVHLYAFGVGNKGRVDYETVRACRQTEILEGISYVGPLTSTTKLTIAEIMQLGYGNKNGLAICKYHFLDNSVIFDMENLGKHYLKPEEREVLLLTGNKLEAVCLGTDNRFLGKDGKPALMYEVTVSPAPLQEVAESPEELKEVVFNGDLVREVQEFYYELNASSDFPSVPENYRTWKNSFKKLLVCELRKFS